MSQSAMCATLVTLGLMVCHVAAFSTHRKSASSSDLSPALKLLERHKRQIPDRDYLFSTSSRGQFPAYGLWDNDEPSDDERLWVNAALDNIPNYRKDYKQGYVKIPSGVFDDSVQAVQPSKEEIENIFSDEQAHDNDFNANIIKKSKSLPYGQFSDIQEKKSKEVLNPLAPLPPKTKKSVGEREEKINLDNLTKEEFKVLMNVVEKLRRQTSETGAVSSNDDFLPPMKRKTEPVSDKELVEMFQEIPEVSEQKETVVVSQDGGPAVEETITDEKEEIPNDLTETEARNLEVANENGLTPEDQYWLLSKYLTMGDTRKKRTPVKRSFSNSDLEETYLSEIQRLQKDVETLRLIAQLEDIENDALTKSLNEATMSQREGTVSEKEFTGLKEAISVEEALQAIKSGAITTDDMNEMVSRSESKRAEPLFKKERKKMDPDDIEESYSDYARKRRQWYDEPVPESDISKKSNYLDAQNSVEEMANDFSTALDDSAKESVDEDEDEYPERSIPSEDRTPVNYLPELNYADSPTETAVELYPTQNRHESECPAAERLVSDCQFADSYGLPIDEEARGLCNRHELCYACGGTKEFAPGQCDNLYRADAALLCGEDEDCVLQAELFLRTLKLKHRYNQYIEGICKDACVNDVLGIIY